MCMALYVYHSRATCVFAESKYSAYSHPEAYFGSFKRTWVWVWFRDSIQITTKKKTGENHGLLSYRDLFVCGVFFPIFEASMAATMEYQTTITAFQKIHN